MTVEVSATHFYFVILEVLRKSLSDKQKRYRKALAIYIIWPMAGGLTMAALKYVGVL